MADIFISYEKSDASAAQNLRDKFQSEGWSTFLDRDIAVGDSWRKRIAAELNQARAIVVLWSAAAVESDWVCGETQFAQKKGKAIRMTLGTDVAIYPDFSQLKLPSPTEEMRSSSVV